MSTGYQHIFFDLDHTIWDFKSNSREVLRDIFEQFRLAQFGVAHSSEFIDAYERINEELWAKYRVHQIDKAELRYSRFIEVLKFWNVKDLELAATINEYYLSESPFKTGLMPGARKILDHLAGKYELHLITNGFKEIQQIKIDTCGIRKYFKELIISEEVGVQKPHPKIFRTSETRTGAKTHECIYIGDHPESDVKGSQNAGWDQVWYNPEKVTYAVEPTYEIAHLDELLQIL